MPVFKCGYAIITAVKILMRIAKINSRTSVSCIHILLSNLNTYFNSEGNVYLIGIAKVDNFESHNSLKVNLNDIDDLFFDFVGWESFLHLNFLDTFALCGTDFSKSIGSSVFSLKGRGYLPLIWRIL